MLNLKIKGILLVTIPLVLTSVFTGSLLLLNNQAESAAAAEVEARHLSDCLIWLETIPAQKTQQLSLWSHKVLTRRTFPFAETDELLRETEERLALLNRLTEKDAALAPAVANINNSFAPFLDVTRAQESFAKTAPVEISNQKILEVMRTNPELGLSYRAANIAQWSTRRQLRDDAQRLDLPAFEAAAAEGANVMHVVNARIDSAKEKQATSSRNIFLILPSMIVINVVASVILAFLFYKHTVGRLEKLVRNAHALAAGIEATPLSPGDEFAVIDRALFSMISALNELRKKEEAVTDNLSAVVCELDKHGTLLTVSRGSIRNFSREPGELIGSRLEDLVIPADQPLVPNMAAQPTGSEVTFCARVDCAGQLKDFRFTIKAPEEERAYCQLVARDVTTEMGAERFRQRALNMVNVRLRQPLSKMSELNHTLSASVRGAGQTQDLLKMLARNADRMLALVEDLSQASSESSGQLTIEISPNNARHLCEQALASVMALSEQKQVALKTEAPDFDLECDGKRIVQVLVNLLSNAVKFSPAGSSVDLRCELRDGSALFKVRDRGRGISEEQQDKLFQKFSQVEQSDAGTGSGVGLAICKEIVELHGGNIAVVSGPGKGSEFSFQIPFSPVKLQRPSTVRGAGL